MNESFSRSQDVMVADDFAQWAMGFSGCDGGNPRGATWLCGIEYGGGDTEASLTFSDVSTPGDYGDSDWNRTDLHAFLKYQYNWKTAKLLCALAGRNVETYREFVQTERCFRRGSNYFKLNLYPVGFRNTSSALWEDWHTRKIGLRTKPDYIAWCHEHRFPRLRQWVRQYSPKLVVCTGTSHRAEFLAAFGDDAQQNAKSEVVAGKQILYTVANDGRTVVAVIYFLGGRYGLKSDSDLSMTGNALAEIRRRVERGEYTYTAPAA